MLGRDHPSLKGPRSGSEIPGLAGLPTHPGRVAERPMVESVSRDDGGLWVEVWPSTAEGSLI